MEIGFDAESIGGDLSAGTARFKIKVSGVVNSSDGSPQSDVVIEKVFGVDAQQDGTLSITQVQMSYDALSSPSLVSYDLSGMVVTYDGLAETLLRVEEELQLRLEQQGLTADRSVLLLNEVQKALEEAWRPISTAGFAAAEDEALANGMAAAGAPTGGPSDDLFAMKLYYNTSNSTLGASAQYNGNIAYLGWQVGCNNPAYYGMQYDHLDRIKKATYADLDKNTNSYINLNRNNLNSINYDKRGNITSLVRRGLISGTSYSTIDNLSYTYTSGTNQLNNLKELSYNSKGFKTTASNNLGYYQHDANGNMSSDGSKGISIVEYNHLNLPKKVTYSNGNWIEWKYDANGTKLKKTTSTGSTKHYINGIEYNGTTVEAIYHSEGRASWQGSSYRYEYTLQDHLGNSRVMFTDLNNDNEVDETEILQQNHYYPFGMNIEGAWSSGINKYQYNRKEIDNEFGLDWFHYGFRIYDGTIGRFIGVDPISDKFTNLSVYNYAANRVPNAIDLHGLQAVLQVHLKQGGQTTSYSVDFENSSSDPSNTTYANQNKYGKRGTLTVVHDIDNDLLIENFEISLGDRIRNALDGFGTPKSGIEFTYSIGQGRETRSTLNAEFGPALDEILGAFSAAKGVGDISRGLKGILDAIAYLNNATTGIGPSEQSAYYDSSKGSSSDRSKQRDSICLFCNGKRHNSDYPFKVIEDKVPVDTIYPERKPKLDNGPSGIEFIKQKEEFK